MGDTPGDAWLPLADAAERLGVSRLRLREAIAAGAIPAQRDNRGLWRVTLAGDPAALGRRLAGVRIDPETLVGLLFDEIEEANLALVDRDGHVERLSALIVRYEAALARAVAAAEAQPRAADGAVEERIGALAKRSDALIERTIGTLERKEADLARVTGLVDRAVSTAAALDAEVARQVETGRKREALLDRAFALAQASLERIARARGAGGVLGRIRSRLGRERGAER